MAHRNSTFDQTSFACTAIDIGAGTASFLVRKHSQVLPYAPDEVFSRHQLQMSGLDGGTFDVSFLAPNGVSFKAHVAGATDADTVLMTEVVARQIKIDVTGMGGSGAPVLHFVSTPRMS